MKLSEAILLGSVGSGQGYGEFSVHTDSPNKCAIGAALFGAGVRCEDVTEAYSQFEALWPWTRQHIQHPVRSKVPPDDILTTIWDINDHGGWTRPQIAAWVETIEPQEPTAQEVPHEPAHERTEQPR